MTDYSSQIKSIQTRYPIDLQKRKITALLNEALKRRSKLPKGFSSEHQKLSTSINAMRAALNDVSRKLKNLTF